jgi:MFS superfamily sulfate permease-like transporter
MRDAVKKFFKIESQYKFEMNDLRALLQLINVALIVFAGFQVGAIFGLCIAVLGLVKDLITDRHINGIAMHLAGVILNIFILFFC